jgi:phytoene dehydrogenase-like protein
VTAPFEADGYRWDLGQLLIEGLGTDEPLGLILAELGIADQVRVRVEDRGYGLPDFALLKPDTYLGLTWRMERLRELFPAERAGLDRYWADYVRLTRVMTLARRMERAGGWQACALRLRLLWTLLPLLPKKDWSAQQLMDGCFRSERLKLVFTSILADFFTPPRDFVGLCVFALSPEASFDKRIPRELAKDAVQLYHYSFLGGIGTWVDALTRKIVSHGGTIHTRRPVAHIAVEGAHRHLRQPYRECCSAIPTTPTGRCPAPPASRGWGCRSRPSREPGNSRPACGSGPPSRPGPGRPASARPCAG